MDHRNTRPHTPAAAVASGGPVHDSSRGADPHRASRRNVGRTTLGAGVVAVLLNLAVHGLGTRLGVGFEVVSFIGMRDEIVDVQGILVMTIAPWTLGSLLLGLTIRRAEAVWPWLAGLGTILALITIPFFNDADATTKATLGSMHIVAGGLWFYTVQRIRRP
jgi:hypothetical protein